MKFYQFLVAVLLYCKINYVKSVEVRLDPLVMIEQGLVRGVKSSDGKYTSFLGIPYAKVNLKNPFGPSEPHPGFGNKIFEAIDGELKCPQLSTNDPSLNTKQDLDCLNLNVYAPSSVNFEDPLPVLVYFHGGDFVEGFSTEYGIPNLVHQGIVVVTPNYRLGAYGFLCLNSSLAPGNQGLKDQYEALRWVKKNIHVFGGNPNDVTLAGVNAGSVSVMLHLYSPRRKLFNKIISQNCEPLSKNFFYEGDADAACKIATHLGYAANDTKAALEFLSKSSFELVTAAVKELGLDVRPCKEKHFYGVEPFIDSDPFTISYPKTLFAPILIANTGYGVPYGLYDYYVPPVFLNYPNFFPFNPLTKNINYESEQHSKCIPDDGKPFYIGDEHESYLRDYYYDYFSNFASNYPIQRTITNVQHDDSYSVYEYVYSNSETGFLVPAINIYYSLEDYLENDKQKLIADRFITICENLVKFGTPTPELVTATELVPIVWAPVTRTISPYIFIDPNFRMEPRFLRQENTFWDHFYTSYKK